MREGCKHSTLGRVLHEYYYKNLGEFHERSMPLCLALRQHEAVVSRLLRRGVFPGSFNPLTIAHLEVARRARAEHALDEVVLMVSVVALDKPAPPGPPLQRRLELIEADVEDKPWLTVATTNAQLIVDIANGFDVVIMGADKWHQVNDVRYYENEAARDHAVARLRQVAVAPRSGNSTPPQFHLETSAEIHDVSSSRARAGDRDLMAPRTAEAWKHQLED